jgi:hypothetical protein
MRVPVQLQRKCACGASAGPEQECASCQELKLQRRAEGGSHAGPVPASVHSVLRSPGMPLDSGTRMVMEPHFRHDFGKVRVHADTAAAESAKAVRAAAYTVGRDVVFGAGQYAPDSPKGRQLLAHELTHVVQQSGASSGATLTVGAAHDAAEREADRASASLKSAHSLQRAPDDEWDKSYGKHKSFLQKPYDEYLGGLGEIRPTTEGGLSENKGRPIPKSSGSGTPAVETITFEILKEIYPLLKADVDADPAIEKQARGYLDNLNQAFLIMKIDTVEAQAYYLAHAFVEAQQFRLLTEIGDGSPQHWQKDPKAPNSEMATKYFNKTYAKGGDVNPSGNAEFIGRGPVQVTHRPEYVEAIAMLEKAAADYQKLADKGDFEAKENAALARKAAAAIKKDPREAANPEYSFLFSAAFLKAKGADVSKVNKTPGQPWTGKDVVGGGDFKKDSPQAKALVTKAAAYNDIYCVLMREAKKAGKKGAEDKYAKYCEGQAKSGVTSGGSSY